VRGLGVARAQRLGVAGEHVLGAAGDLDPATGAHEDGEQPTGGEGDPADAAHGGRVCHETCGARHSSRRARIRRKSAVESRSGTACAKARCQTPGAAAHAGPGARGALSLAPGSPVFGASPDGRLRPYPLQPLSSQSAPRCACSSRFPAPLPPLVREGPVPGRRSGARAVGRHARVRAARSAARRRAGGTGSCGHGRKVARWPRCPQPGWAPSPDAATPGGSDDAR